MARPPPGRGTMAKAKEGLSKLAELGAALQEAAEDTEKASAIQDQILDLIGKLDKDQAKDLFRNEAVQELIEKASDERALDPGLAPGSLLPGMIGGSTIRAFTKRDWTEADLRQAMEDGRGKWVTFEPAENKYLGWNG